MKNLMPRKTLFIAGSFVLVHLVLVAPFVPLANVFPAGLGALSMSSMALALILAARWRIVDRIMGGPDKSYVAHRWLGFFALGGALGHWASAETYGSGVVPLLAESGEGSGTIAAMALLLLTIAAMVRFFPYHLWKASHMLMGPVFLLAAYHTFFVASPLAVGAVPWTLMVVVSIIGLLAWGQTLLRKKAPTRLMSVERAEPFDGGVDVTFRADSPLPAFRPGQFSTIAYNHARAEAHPFTIAGGDETSRRFIIRSVGDWTDDFVKNIVPGNQLRLSAGMGRFLPNINSKRPEQLWVAGGVGITPFLAALEKMESDSGARITLVYCIRSRASAGAVDDVEAHAERLPQVELTVLDVEEDDKLTSERLEKMMQPMDARSRVYLCGPEGLKSLVTDTWAAVGKTGPIHHEYFDFRGAYSLSELIYVGRPVLDAARGWIERRAGVAQ